jgi:hypothetical protein
VTNVTPIERHRRLVARILSGSAAVALFLLILSPFASDRDAGGRAYAFTDWIELGRATFTVADTLGDGKTFPADVGSITTLAPTGKTFREITAASGIVGNKLLLTDGGTAATQDFGVQFKPSADATGAALISFTVVPKNDGGRLTIGVNDGATTELCAPGSVNDGATTELVSVDLDGANATVNGQLYTLRLSKNAQYRIDLSLFDLLTGGDLWIATITNVDTGETETRTAVFAGDYKPVRSVRFIKRANKVGDFTLDNLSILGIAH